MEIISIGNELLIGKTLNTNARWISRYSTSLGVMVKRITVVNDDICEIAGAVNEALQRKARFIITTGGLGPTFDDKTLEGIAKALNRNVEVNEKALEMIKEKYEAYVKAGRLAKAELTPYRIKMATLPTHSTPLPNPIGTAPGVMVNLKKVIIIALPGVPSEMKGIFQESVVPLLKKERGELKFFETSIYVNNIGESTAAPLIDKTMHDNMYVYIKSHPKGEEEKPHLELHFSTTAKYPKIAQNRLGQAIAQLSELVRESGGKIVTIGE